MSLDSQALKDQNDSLRRDLTTALAMIESLVQAMNRQRQFILFGCRCDNRDKELLMADTRFDKLVVDGLFMTRKSSRQAVEEERDEPRPVGEESEGSLFDDRNESSDGNTKTIEDDEDTEESNEGSETDESDWTEELPSNKANKRPRVGGTTSEQPKKKREYLRLQDKFNELLDSSTGQKQFQCSECSKVFIDYKNAHRHYKEAHHSGPLVCPYEGCGRTFIYKNCLKAHHESIHLKKKYKCDWPGCEMATTTKGSLKAHRLVHDGEKKYKCDWPGCDFSTKYKNGMPDHRMRHVQQPQFSCHWPGCNQKGYSENEVRRHVNLTHLKEKKFRCDWPNCEFQARSNFEVKEHMNKHTRNYDFVCSWPGCDKKYMSKKGLNLHMLIHKGMRFKCTVEGCDRDFTQPGTLRVHRRLMHEKDELFRERRKKARKRRPAKT